MTVREPFAYPEASATRSRRSSPTQAPSWSPTSSRGSTRRSASHTPRPTRSSSTTRWCWRSARACVPRYEHAITIDDRKLDETMHGLVQDVEEGYVKSVAFISPGRMAWPFPLYELALMTAGRAYDMNVEVDITIVTPEDAPLAIFGADGLEQRSPSCSRRRTSRRSTPPTPRSRAPGRS